MPVPSKTPAKLTVDFSGVEDRRGASKADHVPPGDYLLKILSCERKKKNNEDSYYLNWYLEVVSPAKYKGKHVYHVTSLKHESLWSLRNFLVDLIGEKNVPKQAVDVPLGLIVKKQLEIGATLEDDDFTKESNGKTVTTTKSKIAATFPKREYQDTVEPDETEATDAEGGDDEDDATEEEDELELDDL